MGETGVVELERTPLLVHDRDLAASFPRRIGIQDGRIAFDERALPVEAAPAVVGGTT